MFIFGQDWNKIKWLDCVAYKFLKMKNLYIPEYLKDPMPKLQNCAEFRSFQNNRYLFCAISGKLYLPGSNIKLSQHVFEMHDIYCLTTRITQNNAVNYFFKFHFKFHPFQVSLTILLHCIT